MQKNNLPMQIYDGSGWAGTFTSDPVSGRLLALTSPGHDLYQYDRDNDTWSAVTSTNKPNLVSTVMLATPIKQYGVTFFAGCNSGRVCKSYLYKHSP